MWIHVDTTSQTSALVAGRPAVIAADHQPVATDGACEGGALTATLRLPSGVTLTRGSSTVSPRAGHAVWHVRAASAGVRRARIDWHADCPSSTRLTLVATSRSPTLRVVSAARFDRGVAVVLRAGLPGVNVRPLRFALYPGPYDAFFLDHPEREYARGRGVGDLFFATGPGQLTASGSPGFGPDGMTCVRVVDPRRLAVLPYRIRFTWNHELGVRSIRRRGTVSVSPHPRTPKERGCVSEFNAVTGPVEGGG